MTGDVVSKNGVVANAMAWRANNAVAGGKDYSKAAVELKAIGEEAVRQLKDFLSGIDRINDKWFGRVPSKDESVIVKRHWRDGWASETRAIEEKYRSVARGLSARLGKCYFYNPFAVDFGGDQKKADGEYTTAMARIRDLRENTEISHLQPNYRATLMSVFPNSESVATNEKRSVADAFGRMIDAAWNDCREDHDGRAAAFKAFEAACDKAIVGYWKATGRY